MKKNPSPAWHGPPQEQGVCVWLARALFLFAMLLASFVLFSLAPRQNCWFISFWLHVQYRYDLSIPALGLSILLDMTLTQYPISRSILVLQLPVYSHEHLISRLFATHVTHLSMRCVILHFPPVGLAYAPSLLDVCVIDIPVQTMHFYFCPLFSSSFSYYLNFYSSRPLYLHYSPQSVLFCCSTLLCQSRLRGKKRPASIARPTISHFHRVPLKNIPPFSSR